MANNVDTDQTALSGTVWSGSALFAYAILSETLVYEILDHLQLLYMYGKLYANFVLTHCILNRLSHTIYWKSPISILGTSHYEIYIFLEKNG